MIMLFSQSSMLLAQDEVQQVFSGPQPGESMEAFDVQYAFGDAAGMTMQPLKEAGDKPTLLIFNHKLTRPAIGLTRVLTKFAEQHSESLYTNMIFLTDDVTATQQRLTAARRALPSKTHVTIAPQGIEGPGAYGLNRKVTLTIVFGDEQKVISNTALIEPSVQADALKIITHIAKALKVKVPTLAELNAQPRMAASGEIDARALLGPVLNKEATEAEVNIAAKKIEAEFTKKPNVATQIGRIAQRIIDSGQLENYGTKRAQFYLFKWAGLYGKPRK
ncbi:MAG: hypothetical protein HN617_04665 [Planctomycetaceae bacterium]|jgi:hypothetical protein|nr:hypothetical protein [Planctomycetaceae bacterium]MBT4012052.1 hypothetical protein [Planctomycetaceae bacterium]MBT4726036.1 hypothetical protein [Planctomycetaceae bacterium]MBT5598852.1 hypothetical protein [Planctomycetaceae bacterium]MBT5882758.1 hypothetical protein [Planctomycetaceae bacterium]